MRNRILEMLTELLNDDTGGVKFAMNFVSTISIKWISLFWGPRLDVHTVLLALKIYAKIKILVPTDSLSSFPEQSLILSRAIQPYYAVIDIYPALIFSLCGIDPHRIGHYDFVFDVPTMAAVIKPPDAKRTIQGSSVILLPILTMIFNSLRSLTIENSNIQKLESHVESQSVLLTRAVQTTLSSLSKMYRHFNILKISANKQENMDKIVGMVIQLLSPLMDFSSSKITKSDPSINQLELFSLKNNYADELNLKWTYLGENIESGESTFSIIQKCSGNSSAAKVCCYSLVQTKNNSWSEFDQRTSKIIFDELLRFLMTVFILN